MNAHPNAVWEAQISAVGAWLFSFPEPSLSPSWISPWKDCLSLKQEEREIKTTRDLPTPLGFSVAACQGKPCAQRLEVAWGERLAEKLPAAPEVQNYFSKTIPAAELR